MKPTLAVTFHLTHACNLRCTYCYTGAKVARSMSRETADAGVDFALALARREGSDHLDIVFFGGEPLLAADTILRICDRAIAASAAAPGPRVSFKMSTNGLLLSPDILRELVARRVYIAISLDGDPEVQDAQRPDAGGHGTSRRLASVIDRLLEANPCCNVTCVATPRFADVYDRSVRWIFDRGFAYVTTTVDWTADWTRADLGRLEAAFERLADDYVERTLAGDKIYLSCFDARIHTWARGPVQRSERCDIGRRQISIAPSGRLYPCVQFVHEDEDRALVIGDVTTGIDPTARARIAAQADAPRAECDGCVVASRCSSWCACVSWQSTGRLDVTSALACEVERFLLPIADRAANRLWARRNPTFLHKHYNPAFPVLSFAERLVIREEKIDG